MCSGQCSWCANLSNPVPNHKYWAKWQIPFWSVKYSCKIHRNFIFTSKMIIFTVLNLQSIKKKLTLELSQYHQSGCTSLESEPTATANLQPTRKHPVLMLAYQQKLCQWSAKKSSLSSAIDLYIWLPSGMYFWSPICHCQTTISC